MAATRHNHLRARASAPPVHQCASALVMCARAHHSTARGRASKPKANEAKALRLPAALSSSLSPNIPSLCLSNEQARVGPRSL
jgi:hypothetical protein